MKEERMEREQKTAERKSGMKWEKGEENKKGKQELGNIYVIQERKKRKNIRKRKIQETDKERNNIMMNGTKQREKKRPERRAERGKRNHKKRNKEEEKKGWRERGKWEGKDKMGQGKEKEERRDG